MNYRNLIPAAMVLLFSCSKDYDELVGQTEITKWQDGKKAAISLTFDDGTINQFTTALPIMNRLEFPATFYIITGKIKGTQRGRFIGRPIDSIIEETGTIPTNQDNLFERASAIGYSGYQGAMQYHTDAGERMDADDPQGAYRLIDEGYQKIRAGELMKKEDTAYQYSRTDTITWEDIRRYAAQGHEFGSHTITHPRLAILDETNLLYELEKSKDDIRKFLGEAHTFSAECPYGTENERVMEYAHKVYPALRNRMPETYLEELNRGSDMNPGQSDKEYVQWQRGPLTNITMEKMKSWVDTCLIHDNVWLVMVFHGVDGIGWEARTGAELEEYFRYIKAREDQLWVATFADVTKYMRERKNASVEASWEGDEITISLTQDLDPSMYNQPLTLKTYVPDEWEKVTINSEDSPGGSMEVMKDDKGSFVLYNVVPNGGALSLSGE